MTQWRSGNASALSARGPGFNSRLRQRFDVLFCCCCVFNFLLKTHNLSQNVAIPFAMFIYFVYLTYCLIGDRFYKIYVCMYKDTDLASLKKLVMS